MTRSIAISRNALRPAGRLALVTATVLTLAACETMKGAGRDIENAGEGLTSEATDTQQQM